MFKKLLTATLIGAGALAMAMPAGAATKPVTESAIFVTGKNGTNPTTFGIVKMHNTSTGFVGGAQIRYAPTGRFEVLVHQYDGPVEVTATLCFFTVKVAGRTGTCHGRTTNNLLGKGWTPTTTAELVWNGNPLGDIATATFAP